MSTDGFRTIISASIADRSDLFLSTANRLGAPLINIEKDFWVCKEQNSSRKNFATVLDSKDPDRDSLKPRKAYWSGDPEQNLTEPVACI
jgi:hypothetical protein